MNQRVRAIIIQDARVLLIKRVKKDETYWVFPGGGIEQGETNEQALSRECKEELGVEIRIGKLFTERPSDKLETAGQVEFFYFVDITGGTLGTGNGPEFQSDSNYSGQYQLQWVGLDKISEMNIKPVEIRDTLCNFYKNTI
jgi:8-oxo-dGTP pyrophosphatase MutT (NUDIX family)